MKRREFLKRTGLGALALVTLGKVGFAARNEASNLICEVVEPYAKGTRPEFWAQLQNEPREAAALQAQYESLARHFQQHLRLEWAQPLSERASELYEFAYKGRGE